MGLKFLVSFKEWFYPDCLRKVHHFGGENTFFHLQVSRSARALLWDDAGMPRVGDVAFVHFWHGAPPTFGGLCEGAWISFQEQHHYRGVRTRGCYVHRATYHRRLHSPGPHFRLGQHEDNFEIFVMFGMSTKLCAILTSSKWLVLATKVPILINDSVNSVPPVPAGACRFKFVVVVYYSG